MTDNHQRIKTERREPTYYARIPRMAVQDLGPYELALYCHYKQIAAEDGSCFKSNATLARETRMSVNRMKQARATLEQLGYIFVTHHVDKNGNENQTVTVTIADIWTINHTRQEALRKRGVSPADIPLSPRDTPISGDDRGVSPADTKEESFNNLTEAASTTRARESETASEEQAGGFDPRPRDVGWGLGMGWYPNRYGEKTERARKHPLVLAFQKGFRLAGVAGVNPPVVADNDYDVAEYMAGQGYTADDVTENTRQKILSGKTRYMLKWCADDMPTFLAAKSAPPETPKPKPAPRPPARPRPASHRVAELPPVNPKQQPPSWLFDEAEGAD